MTRWLAALFLAGAVAHAAPSAPRALDPCLALESVSLPVPLPDLRLPAGCGVIDALISLEKVLTRE